ncbi:unnamed protein product [Mycena citricolor]|uniref:Uncharacterized protein n=1 Tax=Mycena citricolor TaxID=2018698 RepID=A0AAD2H4F2_9AGAR|nr:unnamed protein product [Mycena citricolor]
MILRRASLLRPLLALFIASSLVLWLYIWVFDPLAKHEWWRKFKLGWTSPDAEFAFVQHPEAAALGHPTFEDARRHEWDLPQHHLARLGAKAGPRPKYLFFSAASWGSGWNNVLQEQLINAHLAHATDRAYVFPSFTPRDHPPFPDIVDDGEGQSHRRFLEIPFTAMLAGAIGGGPLSADGTSDPLTRRSVSEAHWDIVCPVWSRYYINVKDMRKAEHHEEHTDAEQIMAYWVDKLRRINTPCVSLTKWSVFDYLQVVFVFLIWLLADLTRLRNIGGPQILSLWPTGYGDSPILKHFAWSPLITQALSENWALLSSVPPPPSLSTDHSSANPFILHPPYPASSPSIPHLLAVHVRRGDYEGHCQFLADVNAQYNAWNALGEPAPARPSPRAGFRSAIPANYTWPRIPDHLDVRAGESGRDARVRHCWPTLEQIVAKVRAVRTRAPGLERVYVATDGERAWVGALAARLKRDGWREVVSSFDVRLSREQFAVSQAVDMSVLAAAEEFIGDGFSSLSSNVVQIRLAAGKDAQTIHFW